MHPRSSAFARGRSGLTASLSSRNRGERSRDDRRFVEEARDDLRDPLPTVSLAERIRALADVANPASVPVRLLEHESQTQRLAPDEARHARLDRFGPRSEEHTSELQSQA